MADEEENDLDRLMNYDSESSHLSLQDIQPYLANIDNGNTANNNNNNNDNKDSI